MKSDWKQQLEDEINVLRQTRDELRVQLHLGAANAHDTWEKVEKSWEHLESRLKRVGQATHESADELESASKIFVEEIKLGYKRIRDAL